MFLLRCHTNRIVHTASLTEEISALQNVLRGSVGGYRMLVGTNVAALRYMHKGGLITTYMISRTAGRICIPLFTLLSHAHTRQYILCLVIPLIVPSLLLSCFDLTCFVLILIAIQDRKLAHTVDYEQLLSSAPGGARATITLPGYEGGQGSGQGGSDKAYKRKNKKRTNKDGQGQGHGTSSGSKAEKRPRK